MLTIPVGSPGGPAPRLGAGPFSGVQLAGVTDDRLQKTANACYS